MTPQLLMGVLIVACIGSVYLALMRKMTIGRFLVALGLCGAVLLVAAQWNTVMQLSHVATAHPSASPTAAPAVHAVIKAAHPSPIPHHHAVVTQTTAPSARPGVLSMQQLAFPSCLGSVLGVLLVTFIAIKRSTRARPASQLPLAQPPDARCPECAQKGDLQIYQYKKGSEHFVGALCKECADRYKATSPREPAKW